MTATVVTTFACDRCAAALPVPGYGDAARQMARAWGWKLAARTEGGRADLCPACRVAWEDELEAADRRARSEMRRRWQAERVAWLSGRAAGGE